MGADDSGKATEQLGHGKAEDQSVESKEEAEPVHSGPRLFRGTCQSRR
jgi:hypothetical protein